MLRLRLLPSAASFLRSVHTAGASGLLPPHLPVAVGSRRLGGLIPSNLTRSPYPSESGKRKPSAGHALFGKSPAREPSTSSPAPFHLSFSSATSSHLQSSRRRLDDACLERYPELSKAVIQSYIAQGKVTVNQVVVNKAGSQIKADAAIILTAKQEKFVCRAGYKLEAALQHFEIDVRGKRVLDSGISTGGFTDCLLQRGAAEVIGVDVGYGQVAERVRQDGRVTILERTNVRHLRLRDLPLAKPVQLVTLDLSFISVLKVLTGLVELMTPDAGLIVLIKPQFEAQRHQVEPGGVVRDPAVHEEVIAQLKEGAQDLKFQFQGCFASPIPGAVSGNKEFLAYFKR